MRLLVLALFVLAIPIQASPFGEWVRSLNRNSLVYRGSPNEIPGNFRGHLLQLETATYRNFNPPQIAEWLGELKDDPELHSKATALILMWSIRHYRGYRAKLFPETRNENAARARQILKEHFAAIRPDHLNDVLSVIASSYAGSRFTVAALAGTDLVMEGMSALAVDARERLLTDVAETLQRIVVKLEFDFQSRLDSAKPPTHADSPGQDYEKMLARAQVAKKLRETLSTWLIPPSSVGVVDENSGHVAFLINTPDLKILEELSEATRFDDLVTRLIEIPKVKLQVLLTARDILSIRKAPPATIAKVDRVIRGQLPNLMRDWIAKASVDDLLACARLVSGSVTSNSQNTATDNVGPDLEWDRKGI